MCNERGGVIDDLYVYRLGTEGYLLVINASRIEADVAWLEEQLASGAAQGSATLINASDSLGAVALQGPRSAELIGECFPGAARQGTPVARLPELKKNQAARLSYGGGDLWVSRTGYTGEDGFEIVAPASLIESVWTTLLGHGQQHGVKPAGLGARDTLRTEMCYPLYGHELDENTTPIEAGLSFFVALDKGEFVGRETMAAQKEKGPDKKLVAFKMTANSPPPRPHCPIWSTGTDSARLGEVTSGTPSPSLGVGIGMGYVPPQFASPGTALEIEIRGKRAPAVVVAKPIYRKPAPSQ
jgi:aminomethyltransferase